MSEAADQVCKPRPAQRVKSIIMAARDPHLWAAWFRHEPDAVDSYAGWFSFLSALFALPMTDEQLALYRRHTGRQDRPTQPSREAWMVIGRRGGKSRFMALVAVYLAVFRNYLPFLAPGERATIAVVAADRRQARVCMRYITALLKIPALADLIERETADGFELRGSVTIEVATASIRATRGYSYAAVICDEIAFWRTDDDSANPDVEVLNAIKPGMATIPTSMLLCASSPHARRGALWEAFRRFYGKEGAPLVWKATTQEMNPLIDARVIEQALERDHASASAEYLAEFRSDIEAFVTREVVEACVSIGVLERPRIANTRYQAFVDPSGGSNDAMTMALGHREGDRIVLDLIRERKPPFSPEATVAEFCETLRRYGVSTVTGDRYAGEWPREQFRKLGVNYRISEKPKSDLFRDLLPVLNSHRVDLIDSEKLINQLVGLERRVSRGGRESIDHAPHAHDDLANAVAGAISLLAREYRQPVAQFGTWG